MIVDLETVDPKGRVDVLAFRGAEWITKHLEATYGLAGIWDNIKPHVNLAVSQGLGSLELPTEVKIIMGILQANMNANMNKGLENG